MADNATLVRSLYDGWNARDFDVLADLMAPDGTITFMGSGEVLKGPEGSRDLQRDVGERLPRRPGHDRHDRRRR